MEKLLFVLQSTIIKSLVYITEFRKDPLSVVLFLVPYNKLCNIIFLHINISFCAYADDFNITIRPKLNDILEWGTESIAVLSRD